MGPKTKKSENQKYDGLLTSNRGLFFEPSVRCKKTFGSWLMKKRQKSELIFRLESNCYQIFLDQISASKVYKIMFIHFVTIR